jgi:hypothetical protein
MLTARKIKLKQKVKEIDFNVNATPVAAVTSRLTPIAGH